MKVGLTNPQSFQNFYAFLATNTMKREYRVKGVDGANIMVVFTITKVSYIFNLRCDTSRSYVYDFESSATAICHAGAYIGRKGP